jgi:hypothetical protein
MSSVTPVGALLVRTYFTAENSLSRNLCEVCNTWLQLPATASIYRPNRNSRVRDHARVLVRDAPYAFSVMTCCYTRGRAPNVALEEGWSDALT